MKNLTLIVHANIKQPLADMLRGLKEVEGFIFTSVEGHGPQDESDPLLSVRDRIGQHKYCCSKLRQTIITKI